MPQDQQRKKQFDPNPNRDDSQRKTPVDKEIDDIIDEADEIVKRNKEQAKKKQPSRQ
ncbi:MAG: hypothetical protein UT29_C0001G0139 [Candidatus Yanofskybacteria bacterium GW2011_GWA1_39_13]|uniref:Prokaryotic ubiquitin-like protein UBact n=1 Tax=Yanofskybacteria sp. (strain GW2011_GWA1_39_13) TaxID=1619019 RepID=UBACT_YANXG|nr:RecName: Full=Prokaryotic ubiquitin-like protein UBact [Candidatus Yanofskybacteria bacterium GW2011_GWA1_39_13]KKR02659.1 MAG: hypothetical protein UT29_C0001G0139 [Candidatus Yanofskybacteria bacterium GW2011_GWA1_39_13]